MVIRPVLIGCEFSGIVRDAFLARGIPAVSCDLEPSERPGPHIQGDIFEALERGEWSALIFFYPCTNMAVSGARWFYRKRLEQARDVEAFVRLMQTPRVERVAGENPVSVLSTKYRKWDQIFQPHHFGHGEVKATCLWLRNLPPLEPTERVAGRVARVHREPPGPDRWKNRSRTYPGVAGAMADQWGPYVGVRVLGARVAG